jgi:hypothetical protein
VRFRKSLLSALAVLTLLGVVFATAGTASAAATPASVAAAAGQTPRTQYVLEHAVAAPQFGEGVTVFLSPNGKADCPNYRVCVWINSQFGGDMYMWNTAWLNQNVPMNGAFSNSVSSAYNHMPGWHVTFYDDSDCTDSWIVPPIGLDSGQWFSSLGSLQNDHWQCWKSY